MKRAIKNAGRLSPALTQVTCERDDQTDRKIDHSTVCSKLISSFSQISFLAAAVLCEFGASIMMDLGGDMVRGSFLMASWRESMMHKGGFCG